MPSIFTVSPDFTPSHLAGWYIFNTWLQRATNESIRLTIYDNFFNQRQAIKEDAIDLIYANPYDAAMLVRDKNFQPLVKPQGGQDEAVLVVNINSKVQDVADLNTYSIIAVTDDPDVTMMGMIMLEAGDLDNTNVRFLPCMNYVLVAKQLIQGNANVGIFLAEAFDDMSNIVKKQLRVLVRGQIGIIHHSLMIGSKLQEKHEVILNILLDMNDNDKGKKVLESLGFEQWLGVDDEEMAFMIDLMDTLGATD
jgi:phosphonate transport system substrate-binding protein